MGGFIETFRDVVKAWEVDVVEHFTVAFYYKALETAAWRLLAEHGADPAAARTVECYTRYLGEIAKGDVFHIESAVIEAGDRPLIGHRMWNTASGTLCTTMEQRLAGIALPGPAAAWDGPARETRGPAPEGTRWLRAMTDKARPEEADWAGRLALPNYIHRFSAAVSHVTAAFGMTPAYMRDNRIGYSTFEFQLAFSGEARPGDRIDIDGCLAHAGSSSLRVMMVMRNADSGAEIARLSQFGVHLDMDARRPARLPTALKQRAEAMIAGRPD